MKTCGRMGGDSWVEAYQKAEEIRVLQRHQGRNHFALHRVKRYLIGTVSLTGMVLKKLESISRKLESTSALNTFIGTYLTPFITSILGSTFVATGIKIGFKSLLSIILSNWILILSSMLTGVLIREICARLYKGQEKPRRRESQAENLEESSQHDRKYLRKKEMMAVVDRIAQITRTHLGAIRVLEANDKITNSVRIKEIREAHTRGIVTYERDLKSIAMKNREFLVPLARGTYSVIDLEKYRNPKNLDDLAKIAKELEMLILRI